MYFVYLGLNSFSLFSIFNLFHATLGLGVCGMYVGLECGYGYTSGYDYPQLSIG